MTSQPIIDTATQHAIDELISAGFFESQQDVLREGVRLLRRQEGFDAADGCDIDEDTIAAIEHGLDDAEAGRVRPLSDVFADLRRRDPAGS